MLQDLVLPAVVGGFFVAVVYVLFSKVSAEPVAPSKQEQQQQASAKAKAKAAPKKTKAQAAEEREIEALIERDAKERRISGMTGSKFEVKSLDEVREKAAKKRAAKEGNQGTGNAAFTEAQKMAERASGFKVVEKKEEAAKPASPASPAAEAESAKDGDKKNRGPRGSRGKKPEIVKGGLVANAKRAEIDMKLGAFFGKVGGKKKNADRDFDADAAAGKKDEGKEGAKVVLKKRFTTADPEGLWGRQNAE